MHFYQVIIGTEILNRRRRDKHFDFLTEELLKRGETLYASFILEDDRSLIAKAFELVKSDPESVMFSFGGIGSTPDDLTRQIAADVFTSSPLEVHEEAKRRILDQFGKDAFPHRIHMAELPRGANLLDNPVNNVPGFSLESRFFFVPGFPKMAHPMIRQALERLLPDAKPMVRRTFTALVSENDLIEMMQKVPDDVTLSSLPAFCGSRRIAVISLSGKDGGKIDSWYKKFIEFMNEKGIGWIEGDRHNDLDICRTQA
ncbi:competence/damage-inducible protein A [Hydrogenimonas urashimensis]|uniref:competence/damage-inducible protein A n=1 Tax=Hydrogenimonas urashimensis TaxID=2740515 RepID=UPI001915DCA4|nr:molybdopterin-binding protein [Hydrogenimonas urashimensis]